MKDSRGFALVGRSVTWATSNVAVASVAGGGLVTGVAPGITTITATSEGMSGTSSVAVEGAPRVAIPTGPTRSRMNAADSVRGQLLSAAVAVALPVEVRQDSDVVVRLLIDPTGSAKVLGDSLASERAAGMHVEPGTTLYGSRMTARLAATGAEVPVPTSPVLLVQSRGLTTWTWVLHPKNPGPQRLWITLTVVGVTPAGGELPTYSLVREYTVRRDLLGKIGDFLWQYWPKLLTGLVTLAAFVWGYLKKLKPLLARRGRKD